MPAQASGSLSVHVSVNIIDSFLFFEEMGHLFSYSGYLKDGSALARHISRAEARRDLKVYLAFPLPP